MKRAALVLLVACGGGGGGSSKYPSRPEGCDVMLFKQSPTMQTENIGPVFARCDDFVKKEDCVRTLKDQVCKLGGDVAWGVDEQGVEEDGKIKFQGRAAHTK